MSSLITNIQNTTISHKNTQSNVHNNSSQNTIHKKYENMVKQKYETLYKKEMKEYKSCIFSFGVFAIAGLLAFVVSKQERNLSGVMGFGGLAGLIISPFFRPNKEKYEALIQKELNEVV